MPRGGTRKGAGRPKGTGREVARTRARRAAIQRHQELTAERTVEEIRRIALANIVPILKCRTVEDLEKLPEALQVAIASFEVVNANISGVQDGKTETVRRIKLADKLKALEMAAKHHGLLIERVQVSGELTLMDKVARARQRLSGPPPQQS